MARSRRGPAVPVAPPILWPDGKHRHWETLDLADRGNILRLLNMNASTEDILRRFPQVTVGTIAAVKANLNR